MTVTVPDGSSREYRITGVLADMGSLLKADVYGMVLTEDGFRQIADKNAQTGTTFRVQFKDGVNIQEAMNEIKSQYDLSDNQVSENTALLGLMGQSENSTMQSLYIVAGFLVLLVLIAGTVMIAASHSSRAAPKYEGCTDWAGCRTDHYMVCLPLAEIYQRGTLFGNTAFSVQCKRSDCWCGDRFSDRTAGVPVPSEKGFKSIAGNCN